MSAKVLNMFSEETPKSEKQMGCMAGIIQMFDRHQLLGGRRLNRQNNKMLPSGPDFPRGYNYKEEHNPSSQNTVLGKNITKSPNENRRDSMESSRDSSSSSCSSMSSSFSSLECGRTAKSIRSDLSDVVKDSINRETSSLSVKTSSKEVKNGNILNHKDSPRPILSIDPNDPVRALVRLKESPWNFPEAPRFSCDGREISRKSSVDSKSANKLREHPRLSLDSREGSLNCSKLDSTLRSTFTDFDRSSVSPSLTSVVAKLMGLEVLPNLTSTSQESKVLAKPNTNKACDYFNRETEKDRILCTLKNSVEDCNTKKLKNTDPISNPISKQTESIYSQIEKRVKELEFQQCSKDLRALKHVLGTMQVKGLMKTKQENQNLNLESLQDLQNSTTRRAIETPIVIMKPAKPASKSVLPSPVIQLEGLQGLRKVQTSDSPNRIMDSLKSKMGKDQSPKASFREPSSANNNEEFRSPKNRTPTMQKSPRPHQSVKEKCGSPVKTSPSLSQRMQQRNLGPENRPQTPTRRQSSNKQQLEADSPRSKLRVKQSHAEENLEVYRRENSNISLASGVNIEVKSCRRSIERISPLFQQGKQESLFIRNEYVPKMELAVVAPEQPSPVSVLDASFDQDDLSPCPVKKISSALLDDDTRLSSEACWIQIGLLGDMPLKSISDIELKKLDTINNLVRNLKQFIADAQEPEHHYVSQILLASGLKSVQGNNSSFPKSNQVKHHQQLMLDVAIGILVQKLELMSHKHRTDLSMRARTFNGQYLFRELCSEIEQARNKKSRITNLDNENSILGDDLQSRSEGWEDFGFEVPKMVLEIERSIFKDLIDELVIVEADNFNAKPNRRRRQLFKIKK